MTRFRLAKDGIKMAASGYDVDTAPIEKLVFSTDWPTLRVKYTGTVTATNISNPYSLVYDTAIYHYPEPFSGPPLVLVAGIVSPTVSDQKISVQLDAFDPGDYSYRSPWYAVNSLADRFELYVLSRFSSGTPIAGRTKTYRYYVFDSLIEAT